MSNIDRKIIEAIKAETEESQEYARELGLFGLIAQSFRGALRWAVMAVVALQVVFAAAVVYCALGFFGIEDPATKLNWLAPGLGAFIAFGLLRVWFFMEINRLSIAREIKRVELQLAAIAKVLRSPGEG